MARTHDDISVVGRGNQRAEMLVCTSVSDLYNCILCRAGGVSKLTGGGEDQSKKGANPTFRSSVYGFEVIEAASGGHLVMNDQI